MKRPVIHTIFITSALLFLHTFLHAQILVMQGDHPDPSLVKIGDEYWASSTTSNWLPAFPLMRSKDLVQWQQVSAVFEKKPAWADYYFWAPEITYDHGKVYVYYAAHKKGGNLCIAVAVANKPEGPYKDLGPLICQEDGSIDAFPMRDEQGKLYLIWKEDANSVRKPTSIWIQQMSEDRTALIGEKQELFRNDTSGWEGNLVEGVSMIRKGEYYYALYAANACCGNSCTYGVGVARAKHLTGPWEKFKGNPVLKSGTVWKCPGHGTSVEKDGHYYFLHHAYNAASTIYAGRQGVLSEYYFTKDNWIAFVKDTAKRKEKPAPSLMDEFNGNKISLQWQWSVFTQPDCSIKNGHLFLHVNDSNLIYLGQPVLTKHYTAEVTVLPKQSTAMAGLALIGDDANVVYAAVYKDSVFVIQRKDKQEMVLSKLPLRANQLKLQLQVENNTNLHFFFSTDGTFFKPLNRDSIDISYLPPWDRAVRAGIICKGTDKQQGVFDQFVLKDIK